MVIFLVGATRVKYSPILGLPVRIEASAYATADRSRR